MHALHSPIELVPSGKWFQRGMIKSDPCPPVPKTSSNLAASLTVSQRVLRVGRWSGGCASLSRSVQLLILEVLVTLGLVDVLYRFILEQWVQLPGYSALGLEIKAAFLL